MVQMTIDIPYDVNKMIRHYQVENDIVDKREALIALLREHNRT